MDPRQPAAKKVGVIPDCATAGCGRTCCEFAEGNYIALYPGEVESAIASGASLEHLELAPLPIGGHRAVCRAVDKSSCDSGYKPLDCASYPLFPTCDHTGELGADLKGGKCPLRSEVLKDHREWVIHVWNTLVERLPAVRKWVAAVKLIGYRRIDAPTHLSLASSTTAESRERMAQHGE